MASPVFLSSASQDRALTMTICKALEQRGVGCWISSRDIRAGQNFQVEIVRAIRAAKVMVLVFSANSNNSDEVKKEIALAGQHHLMVIPVRVEDVAPDEAFIYEFATRQWIDLFEDWELHIGRLVEQISNLTGIEQQAAAAPTPADASLTPAAPSVPPKVEAPPPQVEPASPPAAAAVPTLGDPSRAAVSQPVHLPALARGRGLAIAVCALALAVLAAGGWWVAAEYREQAARSEAAARAASEEQARQAAAEKARQEDQARVATTEKARQEEQARQAAAEKTRQEEQTRLAAAAAEKARQEEQARLAAATETARREEEARRAAASEKTRREAEARQTIVTTMESHESKHPASPAQGEQYPRIGVEIRDLTPDVAKSMKTDRQAGAVVVRVQPGLPAARAGLTPGDLVVAADRKPVKSAGDLRNAVGLMHVGDEIQLVLVRDGIERSVRVQVEAGQPGPAPAPR